MEWGYGRVGQLWRRITYKDALKIFLMPVANMYHVAQLLTNCMTCVDGNIVSRYFRVMPPSLEDYLGNLAALVPLERS